MFEGVFVILRLKRDREYLYQLIETKECFCLSSGSWEQVTKTLRKYVMNFASEFDFFNTLNKMDNRVPSPATQEQRRLECEINGDAFDYDIMNIIKQAEYDRKYGNTPPARLPKNKVQVGLGR